MVAIMAGAELGLAPFQSLQSFAVINGRPTLWGDGLVAMARSRGVKVKEWLEGEGEAMVAHCEVTRPDNGEVITVARSPSRRQEGRPLGQAGPWQQYPQRMLQHARPRMGAARRLRRHAPRLSGPRGGRGRSTSSTPTTAPLTGSKPRPGRTTTT
jgi:hypothetical protein